MAAALQEFLPACPGRHCLFLGGLGEHVAFASWSNDGWAIAQETEASATETAVRLDLTQLPFASASVDVLVLPMTLDSSPLPQKVIREAERVMRDDGLLILFGVNPWSPWYLLQHLSELPGRIAAQSYKRQKHWLSRRRICEWLTLLGLDPEQQLGLLHGLPLWKRNRRTLRIDGWWQKSLAGWGTLYAIKAVKRTLPLTRVPAPKRRFRFQPQPSRPTVAVGRSG